MVLVIYTVQERGGYRERIYPFPTYLLTATDDADKNSALYVLVGIRKLNLYVKSYTNQGLLFIPSLKRRLGSSLSCRFLGYARN